MIVNRASLADLFVGFQAAYNTGFRSSTPIWPQVATSIPSSTSEEHYGFIGQFPRLREWIGDRQVKHLASHDYRVKNRKFEVTVGVKRDDLDDDRYGIYNPMFQEMGYAAVTHPDELVFALLAAAWTTACYDGQYMIDTDHPVGVAGQEAVTSVSNSGGGSGTPWYLLDCSRPLKPIIFQKRREYDMRQMTDLNDSQVFKSDEFMYGVDARCNVGFGFWQQMYGSKQTLNQANYEAARAAMKSLKSDEGRPLGIKPTHVVVPPSLESAANSTFKVQKGAGGADNPIYNDVQIIVAPWLS